MANVKYRDWTALITFIIRVIVISHHQFSVLSSQSIVASHRRRGRREMGFGIFFPLFCCAFILFFSSELSPVNSSIPGKFDGFIYGNNPAREDSIIVEAFMDPICSDSRDSWEPLKLAFEHYSPSIFLMVHPFPLP